MTDEEKKRIVRESFEAFNRQDLDAVAAPFASTARLVDVPTGEVLTGKEGAKQFARRWITAFPDGKVTIENLIVSGDTVVTQYTGEGTQKGPLGPLPASNKRAKLRLVDIAKFDAQGKIVEDTAYYDQLSMLQQLGHAPMPAAAAKR